MALTLAVDPFEQNPRRKVNIATAFVRVIRYRVVIQMPAHPSHCCVQHLRLAQSAPVPASPVRKVVQAEPELLSAGAPFELEMSLAHLAAIMGESQKGELLGLLPLAACVGPCKPAKFNALCLFRRQFQTKPLQSVFQLFPECYCFGFVLKASRKIIGKAKVVRLPPAALLEPPGEPQIQRVMQIDIR